MQGNTLVLLLTVAVFCLCGSVNAICRWSIFCVNTDWCDKKDGTTLAITSHREKAKIPFIYDGKCKDEEKKYIYCCYGKDKDKYSSSYWVPKFTFLGICGGNCTKQCGSDYCEPKSESKYGDGKKCIIGTKNLCLVSNNARHIEQVEAMDEEDNTQEFNGEVDELINQLTWFQRDA